MNQTKFAKTLLSENELKKSLPLNNGNLRVKSMRPMKSVLTSKSVKPVGRRFKVTVVGNTDKK